MREVVIPGKRRSGGRPKADSKAVEIPVVILPAPSRSSSIGERSPSARPSPPPRSAASPRPTHKARKQRDFIVRYDGRFICHFRSRRPLSSRIAFLQVARELKEKIPGVALDRLVLFRPVKLGASSSRVSKVPPDGSFFWFTA